MEEAINPAANRGGHSERQGQKESKSEGQKHDGKTREEAKRQAKGNKEQETSDKRQREAEEIAKEAKKRIDKAKAEGKQAKISFKESKDSLEVLSRLQDEKPVEINPDELKNFKNLLIKYGYLKTSEVNKLTPEQIVVVFQVVAREVGFEELKKKDFVYTDGENRDLEELSIKSLIRQAEDFEEETLTVGKVSQYLKVEKFGKTTEEGGPGTMGRPDWTEGLPKEASPELNRYINEIRELEGTPDSVQYRKLPVVERSLTEAILKGEIATDEATKNVREILEARIDELSLVAAEEARAAAAEARGEGGFITREEQSKLEDWLSVHDQEIEAKFHDLDPRKQEAWVGQIERRANSYYKQVISGFGITPEQAKSQLLAMAALENDESDPEKFRRWRALRLAKSLDTAVNIRQIFETPVIWEETPQKLAKIYSTVEATDLSIEEMGATVQEAINMIRNIAPDSRVGREMRDDLINELEAFRAIHSLRIQLERQDMDPGNFLELYRGYFKDETLPNFVKRFLKDERGREFLDKDGKPVNLLDESFELYSEQLRQERIMMNMVEEMTRHEIGHSFSGAELRGFREWLGIKDLTPEQWDQKKVQIEELRRYFVKKMQAKIDDPKNPDLKGFSVDDVWGRKRVHVTKDGREISLLDITRDVIQDWHRKKTLQGAFGIVEDSEEARAKDELTDIDDLMEEFGIKDREEARRRFLDKKFLDIRRGKILEGLEAVLHEKNVNVRSADGETTKPVDFEALREFGTLDSADKNAFFFAWMMEFPSYDSIRIYSRDSTSKLRDDFDHVVFHASTNLFFGRQIDQTWEFLHEQNENRGRSKENDVNRIWKSKLPGKHCWVFPQNGIATRWADFFMTQAQNNEVERRAREMMGKWDFDNKKYHKEFYDWMRNAVKRDMVESGEISFGKGAGHKLSEIAQDEKLRKFEFVDVFIDRASHKKFCDPPVFQTYLANPTEGNFIDMNDKVKGFYSTRGSRQFPWNTLAYRAHLEVVMHHNKRLLDVDDATSAQMEELADGLVTSGNMEKQQGVKEKRKNLGFSNLKIGGKLGPLPLPVIYEGELPWIFGTTPFRRARQYLEGGRKGTFYSRFGLLLFLIGFWAGAVELAKQLPKQITQQVSGR